MASTNPASQPEAVPSLDGSITSVVSSTNGPSQSSTVLCEDDTDNWKSKPLLIQPSSSPMLNPRSSAPAGNPSVPVTQQMGKEGKLTAVVTPFRVLTTTPSTGTSDGNKLNTES